MLVVGAIIVGVVVALWLLIRRALGTCYVCRPVRRCGSLHNVKLHMRQVHTINYRPDELEPFG